MKRPWCGTTKNLINRSQRKLPRAHIRPLQNRKVGCLRCIDHQPRQLILRIEEPARYSRNLDLSIQQGFRMHTDRGMYVYLNLAVRHHDVQMHRWPLYVQVLLLVCRAYLAANRHQLTVAPPTHQLRIRRVRRGIPGATANHMNRRIVGHLRAVTRRSEPVQGHQVPVVNRVVLVRVDINPARRVLQEHDSVDRIVIRNRACQMHPRAAVKIRRQIMDTTDLCDYRRGMCALRPHRRRRQHSQQHDAAKLRRAKMRAGLTIPASFARPALPDSEICS